jgi:hypothetical protein
MIKSLKHAVVIPARIELTGALLSVTKSPLRFHNPMTTVAEHRAELTQAARGKVS